MLQTGLSPWCWSQLVLADALLDRDPCGNVTTSHPFSLQIQSRGSPRGRDGLHQGDSKPITLGESGVAV